MKTLTIELTDEEFTALEIDFIDVSQWINSFVKARAQASLDAAVQRSVRRSFKELLPIKASKPEVLQDAISRGWEKPAKEKAKEAQLGPDAYQQPPIQLNG